MVKFYTVCLGIATLLFGNAVSAPMPMPINLDMGDDVYARLTDSSLHIPRSYIMAREYLYARKTPAPPADHRKPAANSDEEAKAALRILNQKLHWEAANASDATRMAQIDAKNAAVNNGWSKKTVEYHTEQAQYWSKLQEAHAKSSAGKNHDPDAAREAIDIAKQAKTAAEASTATYNQERPPPKGVKKLLNKLHK